MEENSLQTTAAHLKSALEAGRKSRCFIGFDGFTDHLYSVVDQRLNPQAHKEITTIKQFSERIADASGKSTNIELFAKQTKVGGNGPIMTLALLEGGHSITYAGAVGEGEIEPLFAEMAERCVKCYPLCASGESDAMEFEDGKIIFGKHQSLLNFNINTITDAIGEKKLQSTLDQADLFASVNWTMLPLMNTIWDHLLRQVIPTLSKKTRWFFIDLADPAKRTDEDLGQALTLIRSFESHFKTVLGLNRKEAERIAQLLNRPPADSLTQLAETLRSALQISQVLIHSPKEAVAADENGTYRVNGPYTPKPMITTGAGDNFNGGYLNGLLFGLKTEEALITAVYTSGYYVRHGHSPSLPQLIDFLSGKKSAAVT